MSCGWRCWGKDSWATSGEACHCVGRDRSESTAIECRLLREGTLGMSEGEGIGEMLAELSYAKLRVLTCGRG